MELKYTRIGDYKLPNLTLNNNEKGTINNYGMLRLDYLKQHKKVLYTTLLMKDELTNHLVSVSKAEEIILNELIYTENVWVRTHILCLASTEFVLPYKFYMGIPIPLMFRKEILNYENKK